MNINKKYAVFGVAAVIAVAGVIYFGTSANQQASVANVADKLSGTSVPVNDPTKPPVPNPLITEFQWRKLCRDRQPHIQVLSPNGGESYQIGRQMPVKWRSCNIATTNNVWLHLLNQNTVTGIQPIQLGVNDGNQLITLPEGITDPSHSPITPGIYKVRVGTLHPNTQWDVTDESDNIFTINQAFTAKLKLSEDVNNPKDRTVIASHTATTNDVSMLKFSFKAEGSDLNIRKIALPATATGVSSASKISSYYKLKHNGNVISSFTLSGTGTTPTITFGDPAVTGSMSLNGGSRQVTIAKDTTASFEVIADVNPINTGSGSATNFDAGDTLKVEFPVATLQSSAVTVLDQIGDTLGTTSANRTGSATGYNATFRTQGISTTLNSAPNPVSTVSSTSGAVTSVSYRIRLNVMAAGSDFYIPRGATFIKGANTATVPSLVSSQSGISFGILDGANTYVDGATAGNISTPASEISSSVSLVSGGIIDPSGRIKVPQGQTAVFDIAVTISEGIVSSDVFGRYKIGILSVNGATTSIGAISNFNTTPVVNYQTQFNSPAFQ